jgi:DNA-binding transcriptional MerR regulator
VDVETIRYYELAGLLPAPARQANGYRDYGDKHLELLAFIRHCRVLDLPLVEIKRLLELLSQPSSAGDDVDRLIEGQLERVRTRIRSLHALERQLSALRSCCAAPQTAAECGILHELLTTDHNEALSDNLADRRRGGRQVSA